MDRLDEYWVDPDRLTYEDELDAFRARYEAERAAKHEED